MRKRKLQLNRETLLHLEMGAVRGGSANTQDYCPQTDDTCQLVCPLTWRRVPSVDGCGTRLACTDSGCQSGICGSTVQ